MTTNSFLDNSNQPNPGDSNYDPIRSDKIKIPAATKRNYEIADFYIALKMMKCFCYRQWMSLRHVVGPNGERINSDGQIYMPKFKRINNGR